MMRSMFFILFSVSIVFLIFSCSPHYTLLNREHIDRKLFINEKIGNIEQIITANNTDGVVVIVPKLIEEKNNTADEPVNIISIIPTHTPTSIFLSDTPDSAQYLSELLEASNKSYICIFIYDPSFSLPSEYYSCNRIYDEVKQFIDIKNHFTALSDKIDVINQELSGEIRVINQEISEIEVNLEILKSDILETITALSAQVLSSANLLDNNQEILDNYADRLKRMEEMNQKVIDQLNLSVQNSSVLTERMQSIDGEFDNIRNTLNQILALLNRQ